MSDPAINPKKENSNAPFSEKTKASQSRAVFDQFKFFVLFDFARQLFGGKLNLENDVNYKTAKANAVNILLQFPIIHGSAEQLVKHDISLLANWPPKDDKEKEKLLNIPSHYSPVNTLLSNFFLEGSFTLDLHLYEACVKSGYNIWAPNSSIACARRVCHSIYEAFYSYAGDKIVEAMTSVYQTFENSFSNIVSALPSNVALQTAKEIFEPIADRIRKEKSASFDCQGILDPREKIGGRFDPMPVSGEFIESSDQAAILNTIFSHDGSKIISEQIIGNKPMADVLPLPQEPPANLSKWENEMYEKALIISEADAWSNPLLENSMGTIEERVVEMYWKLLSEHKDSTPDCKPLTKLVLTEDVTKSWKAFSESDKGVSYTYAYHLANYLRARLHDQESITRENWYDSLAACEGFLQTRAWYAKPQTRRLLTALENVPFKTEGSETENSDNHYAHYYACYRSNSMLGSQRKEELANLALFATQIMDAWQKYRDKTKEEFEDLFSDMGQDKDMNEINLETLFTKEKKGR